MIELVPPTSPEQGLSIKNEALEVVRTLEVPQGWDTSKTGVRRWDSCFALLPGCSRLL